MARRKSKSRRRFSPAQLAAQRRFAEMARARAKKSKAGRKHTRRTKAKRRIARRLPVSPNPITRILARRSPRPMARRKSKSRRRRSSGRGNVGSRGFLGLPKDTPITVAAGVAGALAARFVVGKVAATAAPDSFLAKPLGQALVKAAAGVGMFMAAKKFNRSAAHGLALGAMLDAGMSAYASFRPSAAAPALQGFDDSVAGYIGGDAGGVYGMGAYAQPVYG